MPANNPSGENSTRSFGGFGPETPYGAIKRLQQSLRAAPIEANPALSAPGRLQRQATSGGQAPPQPVPAPQQAVEQVQPQVDVAGFWTQFAQETDDPYVRELASTYTGML